MGSLVALVAVIAGLAGPAPSCAASRVHYAPYPGSGASGLGGIPWLRGRSGLAALLWYWPQEWEGVRRARIFTGGVAPAGTSTKVMWVFTGRRSRHRGSGTLVVRGRRLDAPGSFRQSFGAIEYGGQRGAPSFASIVDVPVPGCWRLKVRTGKLRSAVTVRAVK